MWNRLMETLAEFFSWATPTFYGWYRRWFFCHNNKHRVYTEMTSVFIWDYCKDCQKKLGYRRR